MKKIISKREYDTEAAELVQKFTSGCYGDAAGYEESRIFTVLLYHRVRQDATLFFRPPM